METPKQDQMTVNQALSNLKVVIEHHFVGKKQDHILLEQSIIFLMKHIADLEVKVQELDNSKEKSREG